MNKNTTEGTAKKVEGWVQEKGGHIRAKVDNALGDSEGAAQGTADETKGVVKQAVGTAQKKVGEVQDAAKKAFNNEE